MFTINLSELNQDYFNIIPSIVGGEECYLVTPHKNFFDWSSDVLHFRSSVWDKQGHLVSAGYRKFFNLGEAPAITPFDGNILGCTLMEKMDGSCLIVSKWRGSLILRTRGRMDARLMPNGDEMDLFLERYGTFFNSLPETHNQSYIFEWISPRNQIVLKYDSKVSFYLTNIIHHTNYSLTLQSEVDKAAQAIGCPRPKTFTFHSISDLTNAVATWIDSEGICLYYEGDQQIRKVKSFHYLKWHSFKSNCNIKTLTELYFEFNRPDKERFKQLVVEKFDYECLKMSETLIEMFYNDGIDLLNQLEHRVQNFVADTSDLDQKFFALRVMDEFQSYSQLPAIAFSIRKGAPNLKSFKTLLLTLLDESILQK